MSRDLIEQLNAPFAPEDLKTRPGRAGMQFTYVDSRAVAARLDSVFGPLGWEFQIKVADSARCVILGTLTVTVGPLAAVKEDVGYPNGPDDQEPLKSATSDALKRCAAQLGVARSLYGAGGGQSAVSVAPRPKPEASTFTPEAALKAAMIFSGGECPEHRTPWSLKPAGVSKAGKEYSAFWTCSGKTDGQFCRHKPSVDWLASQDGKAVQEQSLEELPF